MGNNPGTLQLSYFLALRQQSEFEKKLFRRQKIWHRKLEVSAIKPEIFAAKLCHLTSDFSRRISEAVALRRKIPKSLQESLDAISRFTLKGRLR
jgi:hypothetical protein